MKKFLDEIKNGKCRKIILDTDTYNEVDDQFALSYTLLSDKVKLLSVNAAPYLNDRSTSPLDGMEKSYNEILRLLDFTGKNVPVYKGSPRFMTEADLKALGSDLDTPAARNIINTVTDSSDPVTVVAIGAITNVAAAILIKPEICNNMRVVWLGGHSFGWRDTGEFNMIQDPYAASVIFDSSVPFLQIPCMGVASYLATTVAELKHQIGGKNELCDYLVDTVASYQQGRSDARAWSKIIWDISAVTAITIPYAFDIVAVPRPYILPQGFYVHDDARAPMLYSRWLNRDAIFGEVFSVIESLSK